MPSPRQRWAAKSRYSVRAVGAAASSCTGMAAGTVVAATHGDAVLAVLVFVVAQTWIGLEWFCRWRLRWRFSSLQEDIVRKALGDPGNEDIRTLLVDVASTHMAELGDRLPARPRLNQIRNESDGPSANGVVDHHSGLGRTSSERSK